MWNGDFSSPREACFSLLAEGTEQEEELAGRGHIWKCDLRRGRGRPGPRPPEPGFPSSSQQESRGSPSDWNHTSESLPLQTHSVTSESFPGLPIKPSWDKSREKLLFRADKRLLVFFHQYLNTCLHSWAITDAERLMVITEADLGGDSRDALGRQERLAGFSPGPWLPGHRLKPRCPWRRCGAVSWPPLPSDASPLGREVLSCST